MRYPGETRPSDAFDPLVEWDGFANNSLEDLGLYAGFDNGNELVLGQCADPATLMSEVQGEGEVTPLSGEIVVVEGVVTLAADGLSGFFIQEELSDQDNNPNTSEALFVFAGGLDFFPSAGDVVRVIGEAREFNGKTQISAQDVLPNCGIDSVAAVDFALPLAEGQSLEAIENMLVNNSSDLFVTSNFSYARFGELVVSSERLYNPTHLHLPGSAEAVALEAQNARNEIILDDLVNGSYNPLTIFGELSPANNMRTGSTILNADFVVDYAFNAFRLRPASQVSYVPASRPSVPSISGDVKVASFNVLNLFNGDGMGEGFPTSRGADNVEEYELQLSKIVEAMIELDASVYGLMELENDGFDDTSSIAQLVDALNARYGADAFAYVDAGEAQGTDAITVGIIYNKNVVTPVNAVEVLDSSNSIVDEAGPLFNDNGNRPSFAQLFSVNDGDGSFVVNVNHLRSKGGSCGEGDDDFVNGQAACNLTRTRAAQAIHVWLADTFANQAILLVGDLNAYAKEDPLTTLNMAGYVNVASERNGPLSYSYTFRSRFGSLDHILANSSANELVTDIAEWHINSDEPVVFDYNDTLPNSNSPKPMNYIDSSAYRSSDHDPIIVGLTFPQDDFMLGDVNGNGRLDFGDYFGIFFIRGTAEGDARFNPAADMNEDGRITRTDMNLWFKAYRESRRSFSLFF